MTVKTMWEVHLRYTTHNGGFINTPQPMTARLLNLPHRKRHPLPHNEDVRVIGPQEAAISLGYLDEEWMVGRHDVARVEEKRRT